MYELVNTSLPNGLIAGTHGFATVAMTKGVSDVLRGRLETLCAYTHRTIVHDATYYQQNPVNWFHVILPQGEHVVGRVTPSDFDYTGRTNRLARLRVFGASEMPAVGGAEILTKEKHWFTQPWQGDPRYLEEDRNTCGHLRILDPIQATSAPAWDALFGANGSHLARQFAWQLEKNLTSGGKAIYFKTSAAWDVSGEKLLGLFVDVINLLPVAMRSRVTFSTYPVSLSGGTGCNLRGIYDRDKLFDASSAAQAWVDCESAKVIHAEMLPTSGPAEKIDTRVDKGGNKAREASNRFQTASSSIPRVNRPSALGGTTNSYRNLLAPQKKGPDWFIVGLVVAGAIILLAAGGFFIWLTQRNKQQMLDSGAAAAVAAECQSRDEVNEAALRKEREAQERKAREDKRRADLERKEAARKAAAEKAKAESEAKAEKKKAAKKAAEDAKVAADFAAAKAKKERETKEKIKVAFLEATESCRGCPIYETAPNGRQKPDRTFDVNDGCRVYYYNGYSLTNEVAGIKVVKHGTINTGTLKWGDGLSKTLDDLKKASKGIVVWYNPKYKRVFIDLARRSDASVDGERWFAFSSEVNLRERYFGTDKNIEKLWAKFSAVGTLYLISWSLDYDGKTINSAKPIRTDKEKMTDVELIPEMQKKAFKDFDEAIRKAEAQKVKHSTGLADLQIHLKKAQDITNVLNEAWCEYNNLRTKIASLKEKEDKEKKKDAKKEIKKQIKDLQEQCENILIEGVAKPTGKTEKKLRAFNNIQHLTNEKESKKRDVEKLEKDVEDMNKEVSRDSEQVEYQKKSKQIFLERFAKSIKNVKFTLSVVGERIQE